MGHLFRTQPNTEFIEVNKTEQGRIIGDKSSELVRRICVWGLY